MNDMQATLAALKTIEPGQRVVYFTGRHCNDCAEIVRETAWRLHIAGQKRIGEGRLEYIALGIGIAGPRPGGRAARPGVPSAAAVRPAG